jgi:hypothetical protein
MVAPDRKDKIEKRYPMTIAETLKEEEDALALIEKGMIDCLEQKEDSPTIEDIEKKLDSVWINLTKANARVPGGLTSGIKIPIKDRIGKMPPEIVTDKDLRILSIRYNGLVQRRNDLSAVLSNKHMRSLLEKGNKTNEILLAVTTGGLVPLTILAVMLAAYGTKDEGFLLKLGSLVIVACGGTTAYVLYKPSIIKNAKNVIRNFRECGTSVTAGCNSLRMKGYNIRLEASIRVGFAYENGKVWVDDKAHAMVMPIRKVANRFRFRKGPNL